MFFVLCTSLEQQEHAFSRVALTVLVPYQVLCFRSDRARRGNLIASSELESAEFHALSVSAASAARPLLEKILSLEMRAAFAYFGPPR